MRRSGKPTGSGGAYVRRSASGTQVRITPPLSHHPLTLTQQIDCFIQEKVLEKMFREYVGEHPFWKRKLFATAIVPGLKISPRVQAYQIDLSSLRVGVTPL